jgi:bacillithiol synthase
LVTRALAVRARIGSRLDPAPGPLQDALLEDIVQGGPLARERFATQWSDTGALQSLAEAKRGPLPAELGAALLDYHRRLGASPASLAALDQLTRGEAVCAVAGQQPAPLGGPLYSLHKTASTAGFAAAIAARTGVPCVPMFWMHGEDSDFAEIRSITLGDRSLALHDLVLPASAHREAGLLGGIPLEPVAALESEALAHWEGLEGRSELAALLTRAGAHACDLGEAYSALMLAIFAEQGLVVIDPRLPAFRAAARPVIDRYLARAEDVAAAATRAGDRLEATIGRRPLAASALDSFVFAIEDGTRRKVSAAEARALGAHATLSPSVALRPAVQDGVFPTVAMACGAGEAAYLAQLREVFEAVGVRPACVVPRLSATWLPPAGAALIEASGASAGDVLFATDAVLKRRAEAETPAEVRDELERAQREANEALARFAEASRRLDPSLPQMVESARGKVDFQFARLREGVAGKVRHRIERQHPEWLRLRYYLYPGDRLQERRLSSLEPLVRRGLATAGELCELAAEHARRLAEHVNEHLVLDL